MNLIFDGGTVSGGIGSGGVRNLALNFTGGTNVVTVQSLGGLVGDINIGGAGSLNFDQPNNLTIANSISGNGSITKSNSGTLTLTGVSTYTGTTTVSTGILALVGSGSVANSSDLT